MLAHKKDPRSWVGNDPQLELHILGQKYPITTDIVIGWVLAQNNKNGYRLKATNMECKFVNALRPKSTQKSGGQQPTTAKKIGHQAFNSDAVGIDSYSHEHMQFGWLSAHSNKHSICMGIASSGTKWYVDRYTP